MSKILLEHGDKKYTLEFNKDSVRLAERRGFVLEDLFKFPQTNLPLLVHSAFHMHHKYLSASFIDQIWEDTTSKSELVGKLAEMYNEPITELIGLDENADKGKKGKWEVVS